MSNLNNTAYGNSSLVNNVGSNNSAFGANSLYSQSSATNNTGVGTNARGARVKSRKVGSRKKLDSLLDNRTRFGQELDEFSRMKVKV